MVLKTRNFNRQQYFLIALFAFFFLGLFFLMLQLILDKEALTILGVFQQTLTSFPFLMLLVFIDFVFINKLSNLPYFGKSFVVRLAVELAIGAILAVFIVFIANLILQGRVVLDQFIDKYLFNVPSLAAIFNNSLMIFLIEFFILQEKQKRKEIEIINLKSENAEYLYNQLRAQINPHFLFNSLNVLVALINRSKEDAILLTKKLSTIYRYVLNHDRDELITVQKELDFVDNYLDILKVRFGDYLHFVENLTEELKQKQIPPMTLQLLIENAVKHNVVSSNQELLIMIYEKEGHICVENNKNTLHKINENSVSGIGLMNLNSRFNLISNTSILINESEEKFSVKIPTV